MAREFNGEVKVEEDGRGEVWLAMREEEGLRIGGVEAVGFSGTVGGEWEELVGV